MSSLEAVKVFSPAQYLEWDASQEGRHEYVGGRVYAMTGATERHGLMAAALLRTLTPMVEEAGCRPWGENRRLNVPGGNYYFPDFFAVCAPRADDMYENDASLVIEVLSRTTRTIDQREKLDSYARLPSIKQYVMVEPDIRRFQVVKWIDGAPSWTELGGADILRTPFGVVDLDSIYEAVDSRASD